MSNAKFSAPSVMNLSVFMAQPVAARVEPPTFTAVSTLKAEPVVEMETVAVPLKPRVEEVPVNQPMLTPAIANARFIDPGFALKIIDLRTPTVGIPRSQITVPISPSENVTDELLFEGAADPSRKFYIPRYRVAQQNVSGQPRYQVALQQSGEEWTVT